MKYIFVSCCYFYKNSKSAVFWGRITKKIAVFVFTIIERNKFREHAMLKEDVKNSYVNFSHHRHHSDITGMYNSNTTNNIAKLEPRSEKVSIKFGINNLQRKFLSSQKKIIREVFSPPVKNK